MTNRSLGIPFTRLYERVMSQMREKSTEPEVEDKYKRIVNQVYQQDIPEYFQWDYTRKESFITLVAEHSTGNVDVTNGSTTVSGGTTSPAFTSGMTGRRFKVDGSDEIYDFTFVSATSGTISPAYVGTTETDASYIIFQDIYDLDTDFSDHTTDPNFWYNVSGGTQEVYWLGEADWVYRYTATGAEYATYWREFPNKTSLGDSRVQISPHPTTERLLQYDYHKMLDELTEFTTGTATVSTPPTTTVTLSADQSSFISAGQYFRLDGENVWRRISSVSGVTVTLENAYPIAGSAAAYTICDGLDMPFAAHNAVFWGACMVVAMEQGESPRNYAALYQGELDKIMKKRNRKRFGRRFIRRQTSARRFR